VPPATLIEETWNAGDKKKYKKIQKFQPTKCTLRIAYQEAGAFQTPAEDV